MHVVTVKLTPAEYTALEDLIKARDFRSKSDAIRRLLVDATNNPLFHDTRASIRTQRANHLPRCNRKYRH